MVRGERGWVQREVRTRKPGGGRWNGKIIIKMSVHRAGIYSLFTTEKNIFKMSFVVGDRDLIYINLSKR